MRRRKRSVEEREREPTVGTLPADRLASTEPDHPDTFRLASLMGNRAVVSLMQGRPSRGRNRRGPVVQRDLHPSSVRFWRVPNYRAGILLLQNYDRRARDVTAKFTDAGQLSIDLRSNLDFLQATEQQFGPEAVESMQASSEAISERVQGGGRGGRALNAAIQEYTQAAPLARGKLERVTAAQHRVAGAARSLDQEVAEAELRQQRREEEEASDEVESVRRRQKEARGVSDTIVDGAIDLLTGDWKGPLEKLGRYVASETVGSFVEGSFESELADATRRLQSVRTRITGLEDDADRAGIDAAKEVLSAETADLRAEIEELPSLARRAESAHENLYNQLSAMGGDGQQAADILDERLAVGETAQRAATQVSDYAAKLDELKPIASELSVSYDTYHDIVQANEEDSPVVTNVLAAARSNRDAAKVIAEWCETEKEHLGGVTQYLTSGSYNQSYEEGIEGALHEARMSAVRGH